jgi:hypothetical protein
VLIGPKGQEILRRYLSRAPEDYCFRPIDSETKRLAAKHAARKTPLAYAHCQITRKARAILWLAEES